MEVNELEQKQKELAEITVCETGCSVLDKFMEYYGRVPIGSVRLPGDVSLAVRHRFLQLYLINYGEIPLGVLEGIIKSILEGELRRCECSGKCPDNWPAKQIMPLLCQAFLEIVPFDCYSISDEISLDSAGKL